MPNWTANQLTVEGDKDEITRFLDSVKSPVQDFDFNQIIPMPKILLNTGSGAWEIDGQRVSSWYAEEGGKRRLFTPEEQQELESIGHNNWYSWSVANWGCKWNATNLEVDSDSYEDEAVIEFNTPWSPPTPILLALREQYPTLEFKLRYRLEDDNPFPHDADEDKGTQETTRLAA